MIAFPRLGAPAFVLSGGAFLAYVFNLSSGTYSPAITSPFNTYSLDWSVKETSGNLTILKLDVPLGAAKGLYNLTITQVFASLNSPVTFEEPNSVYVSGDSYPATLNVAVFSDTHFGVGSYYDITTKILEQTIDTLNSLRPDVVVMPGDLVDGTTDVNAFLAIREQLVKLQIPIIIAQGNNDVVPLQRGYRFWEQYVAPDHFVTSFGDVTFFVLQSDTGDVSTDQLSWLNSSLAAAAGRKVVVLHHPYWEADTPSLKVVLPAILQQRAADLVLMGHTHRDEMTLTPVLSIVTESLSDMPAGYRWITISSSGIAYTDASVPFDQVSTLYLQRNDFSSTGGAVHIKNGGPSDLNLTLLLKLKNPDQSQPTLQGCALSRMATYGASGAYVEVTVHAPPGFDGLASVFFKPDESPPSVVMSGSFSGSTLTLLPAYSDVGLGVVGLNVFYSTDNSTWSSLSESVENRVEAYRLPGAPDTVYIKAVAQDAAGHSTTTYQTFSKSPSNLPPSSGPADNTLLLVTSVVVVLMLLALGILRTMRRK